MNERNLYKLLNRDDIYAADLAGVSRTELDVADGYIHLSTRGQVAETAALHYAGQAGTELLEFDAATIGGDVRWEASRGGALFPHLYADLEIGRAIRRWTLMLSADGTPIMPSDL